MSVTTGATTRSLFKNSVSQIVGRLLLSAIRLVTAALVVRLIGSGRFGEYTLVLSFLLIFEWMVDFGQTDIAVRDIARDPEDEGAVLQALVRLKAVQGLVLSLLLPVVMLVLHYPPALVQAAAIGSLGVLAYAAVQVFRALFKVRMQMERDVFSELASTVALLPATWLACRAGASVQVLIACYMASRLVYLGIALAFAYRQRSAPGPRATPPNAARNLLREALPLGLSGLLVLVYDAIAPVLLSKIADMHAVALYSAPARYVFAVLALVQALNTAFFPVLAHRWNKSVESFTSLQQTALEISILIAVGFACCAVASAAFLMRLIGPGVADATPVLQLMCCIVVVRTVSMAMSPLIVIAGRQGVSVWLTVASLGIQAVVLPLLVPRFGALGAVVGYLLVELITVVPLVVVGQWASGARLTWAKPALLGICGLAALAVTRLLPVWDDWLGGVACPLLFLAFALATRAVSVDKLRRMYGELVGGSLRPAEKA